VIGWDALGGTATKKEVEVGLDMADHDKPAQAASVLRRAARQLPGKLGNSRVAVVICNHEYENIQMGGRVGPKRQTYGGPAVRHLATIRLQLFSAGDWVKRSDGEILGRVVGAKLVKNRLGNPWGEARVALLSGVGIDNVWSVFAKLKAAGIIVTGGSWSAMNLDGEEIKFQGWNGLNQKCLEDSTLFPRLVNVWKGIP
jgi:RecA/RadA recombinase